MTKPFELTATDAIKLIGNNKFQGMSGYKVVLKEYVKKKIL